MRDFELIKVENLKREDEIIIPSSSEFRYYKLIRDPQKRKSGDSYKAVKCSVRVEKIDNSYTNYAGRLIKRISKRYIFSKPSEHNEEVFVDLNYKHILKVIQ